MSVGKRLEIVDTIGGDNAAIEELWTAVRSGTLTENQACELSQLPRRRQTELVPLVRGKSDEETTAMVGSELNVRVAMEEVLMERNQLLGALYRAKRLLDARVESLPNDELYDWEYYLEELCWGAGEVQEVLRELQTSDEPPESEDSTEGSADPAELPSR